MKEIQRTANLRHPERVNLEAVKSSLYRNGILRLKTLGHSMVPQIYEGDTIVVKPIRQPALKTGDIALFTNPGKIQGQECDVLVAHRFIWAPNKSTFYFNSDHSGTIDAPVKKELMIGRVVTVQRGLQEIHLQGIAFRVNAYLTICSSLSVLLMTEMGRHLKQSLFKNMEPALSRQIKETVYGFNTLILKGFHFLGRRN